MNKFTQGPWQLESPGQRTLDIISPHKRRIARIVRHPGDEPNTPMCEFTVSKQDQANANLISAAPDLLEACELALNAFEKNWCIDWNVLEEAIKKARGEK